MFVLVAGGEKAEVVWAV